MRASAMLLLLATTAAGQVFEAASIKPGDPAAIESGWKESIGSISVNNMPLKQLIMYAYDVKEYQIAGGPKWLDSDRFTVVAKLENPGGSAPGRKGSDPRMRKAMQALLAERFQLAVHRESKEVFGYALVAAKSGFKLHQAEAQGGSSWSYGGGKAKFQRTSMSAFASALRSIVERPVVDRTGIDGVYDFKVEWSPDDRADSGPSLFTAVQEQLGLKLEARKVPVDVIAIDRAEKPGEN